MFISMQESDNYCNLQFDNVDCFIHGAAVDDRGTAAVDILTRKAGSTILAEYLVNEFSISLSEDLCETESLSAYFSSLSHKSYMLEGTTLGIVELFLITKALRESGASNVYISYVEPSTYSTPMRTQLLHRRDFDLTDEVPGFSAIPGAIIRLTDRRKQKGVFFLGYEETRFARAFEDHAMIAPANCISVFGVPAFNPGWEMNSFARNLTVIDEKKIKGGIHYCGAENPLSAFKLLTKIKDSCDDCEEMFVVPLGTKPNGIGAILFAIENETVGLLYDHPIRKTGRSSNVAKWHLYSVRF